jgi:hypothetical protein
MQQESPLVAIVQECGYQFGVLRPHMPHKVATQSCCNLRQKWPIGCNKRMLANVIAHRGRCMSQESLHRILPAQLNYATAAASITTHINCYSAVTAEPALKAMHDQQSGANMQQESPLVAIVQECGYQFGVSRPHMPHKVATQSCCNLRQKWPTRECWRT